MIKFPVPPNETGRLNALQGYAVLDTLTEVEFDRITKLASLICNAPISLISLIDEKRQWFKSKVGLLVNETSRDFAFCQYTIMDTAIFEVEDASIDGRFKDNPLVTGDPNIRFYAGFPLVDPAGFALGTLCVIDKRPKILTDDQKEGLQLLAAEVIGLIVERRKKEELKHFEKLFLVSNDLVFIGGMDGFFKKINPAFQRILGWDEQYLLNTSTFELIHPDDIQRTENEFPKLAKGEPTVNFIQRFKTSSGEYKRIQWTSSSEPATGNIFGIGRDITEQYVLEKELEHTREMLEQTNKVARVGGWEFDFIKQTLYWTSITKEIHGASEDYVPDLSTAINFYKEGESRNRITEIFTEAITNGTPWDAQLQITSLQGKDIWVRALGDAEFEKGVCKRVYGTFQDVNDFKLAEQALKSSVESQEALNDELLEKIQLVKEQDQTIDKIREFKFLADSMPQIIWTSKVDGTVDYLNQYWFTYSGKTLQETKEQGWISVLHPDDLEQCKATWKDSYFKGTSFESEYRLKGAADGVYKWHLGRIQPMRNEAGQIIKWFGSSIDIDEYKKAIELHKRIAQFEDFNRIVAHNLRGPAGSIKMILSMMADSDSDTEKAEFFEMLEKSSVTLNETLNDLMKILEVRTNISLPYDDCDLAEIVTGVEAMLTGQIVSKNAKIYTNFEAESMYFPRIYLESIFYNMISNSLKYSMPNIPPEIRITSRRAHDKVIFTFNDNGLGIDLVMHGNNMFKLNKIFHMGFDSKGVGLFMTKTQIETFGGNISVESTPNVGTTFTIEL